VHNLGAIFEKNLTLSKHISAIAKSCLHNIRHLRRFRVTIDQSTTCTIATSPVLLLPPLSILKLSIVTLLYSIPLTLKLIVVNSSSVLFLVLLPKLLHLLRINKIIIQSSLSYLLNSLNVNWTTFHFHLLLFYHFTSTCQQVSS